MKLRLVAIFKLTQTKATPDEKRTVTRYSTSHHQYQSYTSVKQYQYTAVHSKQYQYMTAVCSNTSILKNIYKQQKHHQVRIVK